MVRPDIYAIFNGLITEVLNLDFLKTVRNSVNLINKTSVPAAPSFPPPQRNGFLSHVTQIISDSHPRLLPLWKPQVLHRVPPATLASFPGNRLGTWQRASLSCPDTYSNYSSLFKSCMF